MKPYLSKFQGVLSNLFELSIMLAGAIFVSSGARGSSRKEDLRPPSSSDTSTQLHSGSCSTRPQADRIRGCGSVIPWHKNIMCDIMLWTSTSPIQRVAVIHLKSVCIKQHRRSCFNFIATASCFFFCLFGVFLGWRENTDTHTSLPSLKSTGGQPFSPATPNHVWLRL